MVLDLIIGIIAIWFCVKILQAINDFIRFLCWPKARRVIQKKRKIKQLLEEVDKELAANGNLSSQEYSLLLKCIKKNPDNWRMLFFINRGR